MKKVIVVLCLCLISFVNAEDDMFVFHEDEIKKGWYLGVAGEKGSGSHKYTGSKTDKYELNVTGQRIKFGYDAFLYKIELSYFNANVNFEQIVDKRRFHGVDLDLMFIYPKYKVKPYISFGLGHHLWSGVKYDTTTGSTRELESGSINAAFGSIIEFDKLDVELAYKHKRYNWESIGDLDQETVLKTFYFGINYKF